MSKLYLVGTPIGNLGDLSPRAIETLNTVDFIAAEDTRVTLKLLNHFEISKPMVSYYQHNMRERGEMLVNRILGGVWGCLIGVFLLLIVSALITLFFRDSEVYTDTVIVRWFCDSVLLSFCSF